MATIFLFRRLEVMKIFRACGAKDAANLLWKRFLLNFCSLDGSVARGDSFSPRRKQDRQRMPVLFFQEMVAAELG